MIVKMKIPEMYYVFAGVYLFNALFTLTKQVQPHKVYGSTNSTKLGIHERSRLRRSVTHSDFPSYVQILKQSADTESWSYQCGGSLIATYVTLSACHCISSQGEKGPRIFIDLKRDALVVVAGVPNPWVDGPYKQESYIRQVVAHPDCIKGKGGTTEWDVGALLHFKSFSYSRRVQPLKVFSGDPQKNMKEFLKLSDSEGSCYVIGNKLISAKNLADQVTEISEMYVLTGMECREQWCVQKADLFCQHDFENVGQTCMRRKEAKNPCIVDSGGPVICNGLLFGVVSWPRGCKIANISVEANVIAVTHVANWYRKIEQRSSGTHSGYTAPAPWLLLPLALFQLPHQSMRS